jgi:DNA polymerase I-like protein with 3'-5' exonuclease and polymerase domains
MAPPKASIVYDMDIATARFALGQYHANIPEIERVFWKGIQLQLAKSRTITSPTGGKRIFFGRLDDSTFRDAYSHSAQSVVGDVINRALHLFEELSDPSECRIHLQVHDELVFTCRKDAGVVRKYIPIIKNLMEYPLNIPPVKIPLVIPTEGTYGPNWFDQRPIEELLK